MVQKLEGASQFAQNASEKELLAHIYETNLTLQSLMKKQSRMIGFGDTDDTTKDILTKMQESTTFVKRYITTLQVVYFNRYYVPPSSKVDEETALQRGGKPGGHSIAE